MQRCVTKQVLFRLGGMSHTYRIVMPPINDEAFGTYFVVDFGEEWWTEEWSNVNGHDALG
jgi:hypothetical protein